MANGEVYDLTEEEPGPSAQVPQTVPSIERPRATPYSPDQEREGTRSDLARGLLWLLTFVVGGVLVFIGLGRLEGEVLAQSIFPSLIALAGTALGFYFGSQAVRADGSTPSSNGNMSAPPQPALNPAPNSANANAAPDPTSANAASSLANANTASSSTSVSPVPQLARVYDRNETHS